MGWFTTQKQNELQQTRDAWVQAEALWRQSEIGQKGLTALALSLLSDLIDLGEEFPQAPLSDALLNATMDILDLEEIGTIEPAWAVIDADLTEAVEFRKLIARRRKWATQFEHLHLIIRKYLLSVWTELLHMAPPVCFERIAEGESTFEVPLVELLERPAEMIERMVVFPFADEAFEAELYTSLRSTLRRNMLTASGFPATAVWSTYRDRIVMPTNHAPCAASELARLYLVDTPLLDLMETAVPFSVPASIRFEHGHIVGGTGHGKTQLMQRMIYADLVAAQEERRSVVVIDSQGDLIQKLTRLQLFSPDAEDSLAERLVVIDPYDVEFPAALNLFDAKLDRLDGYRPVDRERVLNGVVELYETFFGDLLGAELTQKQGVIFKYLARLMLTIPGATIHTLMELMDDGAPFRSYMQKLDGSARFFFEREFFDPSFSATKKQILKRLWGVLATPAFERMFAQNENKLDLFQAMNDGKIVLINTAKDLLKDEGSRLFGRFFVAMISQAALERATVAEHERTPTFVYVDEAQEYFDDRTETILNQARKYKVGMVLAHQMLDQLTPRLRAAIHASTSLKCAGGVSARDARALSEELHTSADFIERARRRGDRTEFAVWLKQITPTAIRLSVPLGFLERQPTLGEEAFDFLIEENRRNYCGTAASAVGFAPIYRAPPDEPVVEPVRPVPQPTPSPAHGAQPAPPREGREPAEREPGKGGPKHRYLQALVKELAEAQGFRATIEAPLPDGTGQVDVLLSRDGLRVAVEVSITTPVEWEIENVRKCLRAGYDRVALVLAKSAKTHTRYRQAVTDAVGADRVTFLVPEDVPDFIASLAPVPEPSETVVRGYKVKVTRTEVSPEDAKARRDTLARLVAKTLQEKEP